MGNFHWCQWLCCQKSNTFLKNNFFSAYSGQRKLLFVLYLYQSIHLDNRTSYGLQKKNKKTHTICYKGHVKEEYLVIILGYFFSFLHKNIHCWYSLQVPDWGASNKYPRCMFLWRKLSQNYHRILLLNKSFASNNFINFDVMIFKY